MTEENLNQTRLNAIDERLQMIESDLEGLKSQIKLAVRVQAKINELQNSQTDMYYDLNNKIASIRGMMAVNQREKKKDEGIALPEFAVTEVDQSDIIKLKQAGMSDRQVNEYIRQKAYMEQIQKLFNNKEGLDQKKST